jgi:hypothetical protein
MAKPITFLCLTGYHKGEAFLKSLKSAGCCVLLVTSEQLKTAAWPTDCIDEIFYMRDIEGIKGNWELSELISGISWLMRERKIDRIVALDDFDVEKAAALREHFRIPGMGQTTGRYFRDKLAMRYRAQEFGIPNPAFTPLFNDDEINTFLENNAGPWLIKPRGEASATGIRKVDTHAGVWAVLNELGAERGQFLMEQFKIGEVFHCDTLTWDKKLVFFRSSQYLAPPMEVVHSGGIFRTATLQTGTSLDKKLHSLTQRVITHFGLLYGASHTEFVRDALTGEFFLIETSARVGGAHIVEMVEAASGINLWHEWAQMEADSARRQKYVAPPSQDAMAGLIISLSRQEHPDQSRFDDAEIVWRLEKEHHIGLIVRSELRTRVLELLDEYAQRIAQDYHASAPAPLRSTN